MAEIEFEGEHAEVLVREIGIEEYREIKRKLGLTIRRFIEGVGVELDPDALTGLYWIFKRRAGHPEMPLAADMQFDVFPFMEAWKVADEQDEDEADPTGGGSLPDGSIPALNGSSTTTSETSPTSTSSSSPVFAGSNGLT